jgi:adenylate cyclase class 2
VLTRREIEFKADDFETARRFFAALSYEEVAFYEKYRRTYRLGDLFITLDEMPYGTFTEIEGDPPVLIRAAADMLRLDWSARINMSYLVMFDLFKRATGFDGNELSFDALKDIRVNADDLGVKPADKE